MTITWMPFHYTFYCHFHSLGKPSMRQLPLKWTWDKSTHRIIMETQNDSLEHSNSSCVYESGIR